MRSRPSGINVVAAHKVAAAHPEFARIVTVIPDTGQRYLSGELFGARRARRRSPSAITSSTSDTLARLAAHRDRLEFIA